MPSGPLVGLKVVEFAGIGPGPYAGMLLADQGADVVRIDRADQAGAPDSILGRGKRSVAVDLKKPDGVATALDLIAAADVLIEGYRPGVMERLGLGPDVALKRNPKLVYGRMTGWGQDGPWASMAGHDINYIALAGALEPMGRRDQPPSPPLNLVGDFGGGSMFLIFGILAALWESQRSGRGQVVDCAMVDGAASLMSMFHGMKAAGVWNDRREDNLLDGAAHFYDCYACADGKFLAVGAIEPQFHKLLVDGLGMTEAELPKRMDRANWPAYADRVAAIIRTRTRDEWMKVFEGTDACVAPALSLDEAPAHAHNAARKTFVEAFGMVQPGPAPRFSRTAGAVQGPPATAGKHTEAALADWGLPADRIRSLKESGAVKQI